MISSSCPVSDSSPTTVFSLQIQRHNQSKMGSSWSHEYLNNQGEDTSTQTLCLLLDTLKFDLNIAHLLCVYCITTKLFITYLYVKFNTVLLFEKISLPFYFPNWTKHIFSIKFLLYLGAGGRYLFFTVKLTTCFLRWFSTCFQNCLHKKWYLGRSSKLLVWYTHIQFHWHPFCFA